jgi:transposase
MKKYMCFSQDEKAEIIDLVNKSNLRANRTNKELGIPKRTFYNWYARYLEQGYDGLAPKAQGRRQTWNKIPQHQQNQVVEEALLHTESSSKELVTHIIDEHKWFISESSVYRILKERGLITAPAHIVLAAADEFERKTFSHFKIINWGWYYLITVMDDYSRYIIHWELCKNMEVGDVRLAVDQAMLRAGLNKNNAPTLLSDNGPCFVAKDLEKYLKKVQGIKPIHGRACQPQTQGKIERYHRTMKNVVKLDNYFFPEELVKAIETFVNHCNYYRYHESLSNSTPADAYFGRAQNILKERRKIKEETTAERRKIYTKEKLELQLAN